jgi:hypothetical protein
MVHDRAIEGVRPVFRPFEVGHRMSLEPLNLAPLMDAQNRFRRDFNDFARLWQETKESWRDDRAQRFEREHLAPIGPSLSRFAAALEEFTESLRKANADLADLDFPPGEL